MAKLGPRERREKRARLEALSRLGLLRKQEAEIQAKIFGALPKRERNWLTGNRPASLSLSRDTLLGKTHLTRAYQGSMTLDLPKHKARVSGRKKAKNPLKGPAFAPAFMALGHERLETEVQRPDKPLIKLPPSKRFRTIK